MHTINFPMLMVGLLALLIGIFTFREGEWGSVMSGFSYKFFVKGKNRKYFVMKGKQAKYASLLSFIFGLILIVLALFKY